MFEYLPILAFLVSIVWGYWKIYSKNPDRFYKRTQTGKERDFGLHAEIWFRGVSLASPVYFATAGVTFGVFPGIFDQMIWQIVIPGLIIIGAIVDYENFLDIKCNASLIEKINHPKVKKPRKRR